MNFFMRKKMTFWVALALYVLLALVLIAPPSTGTKPQAMRRQDVNAAPRTVIFCLPANASSKNH
jgi:hypothetical protein